MRLNQTLQKLQGRVHSSPKKLKTDLETRTGELSALRANLSVLEARTRDLTKKCDVLERFEEVSSPSRPKWKAEGILTSGSVGAEILLLPIPGSQNVSSSSGRRQDRSRKSQRRG